MTPNPPYQLSVARQKLIEGGSMSRCARTVAPEVVSPETASKKACVKDKCGRASRKGIVADTDTSVRVIVTSRKPSRGFNSRALRRVASINIRPVPVSYTHLTLPTSDLV